MIMANMMAMEIDTTLFIPFLQKEFTRGFRRIANMREKRSGTMMSLATYKTKKKEISPSRMRENFT